MLGLGRELFTDLNEVIVGELRQNAEWLVAGVRTTGSWPVRTQKVLYRGEALWIMPLMREFEPSIAMRRPPDKSREQCEKLIMRFVSALSWVEEQGMLVDGIGGGNLPRPMGHTQQQFVSICDEFHLEYLPEPNEERTLLAMALMREGRGLNHPGYAFLSFYRVLEVAFPNGRDRSDWISKHVMFLKDHQAKLAVQKLVDAGINDIGKHLRDSNRHAMAHAKEDPIIDPDNLSEMRRLWQELPIISALAKGAIERELGVKSTHTIWEEHLYELDGFKKIFGEELVRKIVHKEGVPNGAMVDLPLLNVELYGHDPYPPLTGMTPAGLDREGDLIKVYYQKARRALIIFRLDFEKERLSLEPLTDVRWARDNGSVEAAETEAELKRFRFDMLGNGRLRIVNAETGEVIGRKDAYIPVNMYLDHEEAMADIERSREKARRRREFAKRYAAEMQRYDVPYKITVIGK
jgi:hypothetical protein